MTTLSTKPLAEIIVEGELSPFEHEALHRLLRKSFEVEPPSYVPFGYGEEDLTTRINITLHHPYTPELFTQLLRENWRELKVLIKEIRYRRGGAGAAVTFAFADENFRLVFRSGPLLDHDELGSAMDQLGHLTGIIGRMVGRDATPEPFRIVECSFDKETDRWHIFRGTDNEGRIYLFDESTSRWNLTRN